MPITPAQFEWIRKRSFINCHVQGVDSIVLHEAPFMRVFFAHTDHVLERNELPLLRPMSVALHSHHCDLTITPLLGRVFNVQVGEDGIAQELSPWLYRSAITSGDGCFSRAGDPALFHLRDAELDEPLGLRAADKHTMWVHAGAKAAWLVEEGAEDPTYVPVCWSNADLTNVDFSELYRPMTNDRLSRMLDELPFTF